MVGEGDTIVALANKMYVQNQGMPQPKVKIQAMSRANQNIDVTVAAEDLQAGQTVLQVPEHLIITLAGVFEDEVSTAHLTFARLQHRCQLDSPQAFASVLQCVLSAMLCHACCKQCGWLCCTLHNDNIFGV